MIKLPDECLTKNLIGTCKPLAQSVADDKPSTFDCCGQILPEYRCDPDSRFRKCCGYIDKGKIRVMCIDISERELIGDMTNTANALHAIANMRENAEIMPFKKLELAVDNKKGAPSE